jgi:hypothetical protein
MTATNGSLRRLALLAAAGSLAAIPTPSLAGPAATPDCLTPPASLSADNRPGVQIPGVSRSPVLLAQAQPASAPARSGSLVAQATVDPAATTESLPACTYDPPVIPTPQTIRGLW